jgi:hypothetical protein
LFENQGEELLAVLIEAQLSMVQLYYQKEQDMVMELNVAHVSLREWEESKGTKIKEEEEDQDVVCEILVIKFVEQTRRRE